MALVEMFVWWYAHGWLVFLKKLRGFLAATADFFSMDSLIRTLFQPFRQISANESSGSSSLDLKFQMFIDRLFSRVIGFFSRMFLLLTGLLVIIVGGLVSLVLIIIWPFIPLLPLAGVILSFMGVKI